MIRPITTLCLLLVAGLAQGDVFLPDAARVTGYGPTRESYSMRYAGACGDRVGVSVAYMGRTPIDQILPEVLQYSRDSAQHVLAKCPEAKTIEVSAQGQVSRPPKSYRFVMRESDNWAPAELATHSALTDALLDSGYLPVNGPSPLNSDAFLRFQDGRLDIVYGRSLEGRMSATHFEEIIQEGSTPPRVSHYVVRGDWYDLGNEQPGNDCGDSREGYPLWGSFLMTINPWGNYSKVQRQRCVDHGTEAKAEETAFSDLRIHDYQRKYDLEPFKINRLLHDKFQAAGNFAEAPDPEDFARTRQPLYSSGSLRVFPQRPDFCSHLDVDAVYRVNSENRDAAFGGSYREAIGRIVREIAYEKCEEPLTVSVRNYQVGDSEAWDRMSFQVRRIRPLAFGGENEKYLELLDHFPGERAKAHDEWVGRNLLGPECVDGPFCDLPGGRYLNAIYRGNLDEVRQMDHIYEQSVKSYLNSQLPGGDPDNPVNQFFSAVMNMEQIQLLRDSANKYMYSYAAWGESCLEPGAQVYKFERTEPIIVETDEWGVTTRSGGEHYEAFYTLNPEFFGLRDQLGSAGGAKDSDHPANMPSMRQVYRGIVTMKQEYGCRSAEVKEFERQLIALTNQVLEAPGTVPPTAANRPPTTQQEMAAPFPAIEPSSGPAPRRIARHLPVSLPVVAAPVVAATRAPEVQAVAPAAEPASPPTRPDRSGRQSTQQPPAGSGAVANNAGLSAVERQQKMYAELQTVAQQFNNEMAAANQAMQQAILAASTPQARAAVVTEYQNNMLDLRKRAQEETMRIQQSYMQ